MSIVPDLRGRGRGRVRKRRQANRKNSGALEKAPRQQLVTHGRGHSRACQNQTQPTGVWEGWRGPTLATRGESGWAAAVNTRHCPAGAHHVSSCSGACPVVLPSFACRGWDPLAVIDEALVREILETSIHPAARAARKSGPWCPCLSVLGTSPLPGSFSSQGIDQSIG